MECVTQGGLFVPDAACTSPPPPQLQFANQNAFYAGAFVTIPKRWKPYQRAPPEAPGGLGRGYRTTIEADQCINWIKSRCGNRPWFATLAFSSAHAPLQPAPLDLVYSKTAASLPTAQQCDGGLPSLHEVFNTMVEAMDR